MMKRIAIFIACVSVALAGSTDGYLNGFITAEDGYQYAVTWLSFDPPLIVNGGGALDISVRDFGHLIVQSTSTPLKRYVSGVYDILLFDNSQLLYLDGVTEFIRITQNNTAVLKGGSINYIKTMRYPVPDNENVFIYAQDGWSWIDGDQMKGIQGNWLLDGSDFRIEFINDLDYGPVWQNIKVVPEPASILFLALGGLLIRRKR